MSKKILKIGKVRVMRCGKDDQNGQRLNEIEQKRPKNEKVRVRRARNYKVSLRKCGKESFFIGRRIWECQKQYTKMACFGF